MVLRLRAPAPNWETAKCLEKADSPANDPWFDNSDPEDGGYPNDQGFARDWCNGVIDGEVCPIREECLLFALVNNERYGVWGGTSEADRKATRKMWPWDSRNPAEPRPEWTFYPPGEVLRMLADQGVEVTDEDDAGDS